MDVLVTIATYLNPNEAFLARGVLESAGIDCILLDEHVSLVYGRPGGGIVGGVRLQVAAEDEQAARALLAAGVGSLAGPEE